MSWFHRWVAFTNMHAYMHTGQERRGKEKGIKMAAHVMKGKDIEEPWEVEADGVLRDSTDGGPRDSSTVEKEDRWTGQK